MKSKRVVCAEGILNIIGGALWLISVMIAESMYGVSGKIGDYIFPIIFMLYGIVVFFPKFQKKDKIITFGIVEAIILTFVLLIVNMDTSLSGETLKVFVESLGKFFVYGIGALQVIILYIACAIFIVASLLDKKDIENV